MANLLYVTDDLLNKLKHHKAFLFWYPIVQNLPIRNVALEDRAYHPRKIDIEDGNVYLTIDMKFAYARDGMLSYLYPDQDLSFRFTASYGILRTLDNKQFSGIIGLVATVTASNDAELVEGNRTFHPLLDAYFNNELMSTTTINMDDLGEVSAEDAARSNDPKSKSKRGRPRKAAKSVKITADNPAAPRKAAATKKAVAKSDKSIFETHQESLCNEIYGLRVNEKKTYAFLAEKFNIDKPEIKRICTYYSKNDGKTDSDVKFSSAKKIQEESLKKIIDDYTQDVCDQVVHMKNVSKKSYEYVAEKFNIPIKTVRIICSKNLKRPRLKNIV